MTQYSELKSALHPHLNWHGARLSFLTLFLLALFKVKTVNLTELALGFEGSAQSDSKYKRLQRFFRGFDIVYSYFQVWRDDGTWNPINEHLRIQVRVSADRHPSPSAALCYAQSVKVGHPPCHSIGFDGGKFIKGRKPHVLVDTLGLVLMVMVTAANVSDQRGAKILFWKARRQGASLSRLVRIGADAGYQGETFMQWVMEHFRYVLEVIKRSDNLAGFKVVPKRMFEKCQAKRLSMSLMLAM